MNIFKVITLALLTIPSFAMCVAKDSDMTNRTELPLYTAGQKVSTIYNSQLEEISGLAASSSYTDHFWVNNDSGDDGKIYLINLAGELVTSLVLPIDNRDWEAITIADGYIYIGEVGDNEAIYSDKKIYRVAEPTHIDITQKGAVIELNEYETMRFNFSDGQRDCEALMFDPISDQLVLISKREEQVHVYLTPFVATQGDELMSIDSCATLNFTLATAGDISLDGTKILVKNYSNIYYWSRSLDQSVAEALSAEPTMLQYDPEPQGEAIAWSTYEDKFYTVSEKSGSIWSVIYLYERY